MPTWSRSRATPLRTSRTSRAFAAPFAPAASSTTRRADWIAGRSGAGGFDLRHRHGRPRLLRAGRRDADPQRLEAVLDRDRRGPIVEDVLREVLELRRVRV